MKKAILALIFVCLFVSGQAGCKLPPILPETKPERSGISFTLVDEVDYLRPGQLLRQEEIFFVGIKISNYDQVDRTGQVCISDDVAESYGGIASECQPFSVRAAELRESKSLMGTKKELKPGSVVVRFGSYKYYNLPKMLQPYSSKLFATLRYVESTLASATVSIPGAEQPQLKQEPAPIAVSLQKSVHRKDEGYEIRLSIGLRKQQPEATIWSPDFSQANFSYFLAELHPMSLSCFDEQNKPLAALIEFENERLIKCSAFSYSAQPQSFPLSINLNYGVELKREFPFMIETR